MNESKKLNREGRAGLLPKMHRVSAALWLFSLGTVPTFAHAHLGTVRDEVFVKKDGFFQTPRLAQVTPQATYGYDASGNTATVVYTDKTCVVHTYDSSGNKTATEITKASVPETVVYGDGVWGCFEWTP